MFYTMMTSEHRKILALALPMILSNLSVPLLGAVDTAVVGHLGAAYYLGGVAIGSMLITFIFWLAGFLRMATTGLTAQAHGRGDGPGALVVLGRSLLLAETLALAVLLLQQPLTELAFGLVGASEPVAAQGRVYFAVRIWSAPAALANLALLGWLLGMHNARAPMWLLILTNLANVVLDLLLVVGLGWGVAGAAAASVVADYLGLALGLWLVWRQVGGHTARWPTWGCLWETAALRGLLALNRDIFLRTLCLQLCFAFITVQGARLGDAVVAANAVLLNFLTFISMGLDGFAYATEAQVGHALGARSRASFRRAVTGNLLWSLVLGVGFSLVFAVSGRPIIHALTDLDEVRALAGEYLPYVVALPLVSLWCYLFDGVFLGASQGRAMRNSMLLSACGGFFPLWWGLQGLDNHALWLALCGFMLLRGVTLGWLLRRDWRSWFDEAATVTAAPAVDQGR